MKNDRGFHHYDGLKILAAIGVIAAMAIPALKKYLEQYQFENLFWLRFSAVLVVTVLFVFLVLMLIYFFLTRDTETKEGHLQHR